MSKKPVSERDALLRDLRGALKKVRQDASGVAFCDGCDGHRPHDRSCPRVAIPAAIRWIKASRSEQEFHEKSGLAAALQKAWLTEICERGSMMKVTMALSEASEPPPFVMSADPMPAP